MPKLRVHNLSVSLDGYAAGPDQGLDHPLGVGGEQLHTWFVRTETFQRVQGAGGGTTGPDDDIARRGDEGIGATIMGRNMFGPVRGPWGDSDWKGWWGPEPPYHHPVFVLTHHAREPIEMAGGTTFSFVTDGIESALEQAFAAAGGRDVRLGGGPGTVREYLRAGLVDELHVAVVPVLLGTGERLLGDGVGTDLTVVEHVATDAATHVRLVRR
ncbi:dihydrofolate reductase family protein [Geodermatophilus sp. SYSU D00815]